MTKITIKDMFVLHQLYNHYKSINKEDESEAILHGIIAISREVPSLYSKIKIADDVFLHCSVCITQVDHTDVYCRQCGHKFI